MATKYTEIQEIHNPGLNNARIQSHLIMIRTYFKFVAPWLQQNERQNLVYFIQKKQRERVVLFWVATISHSDVTDICHPVQGNVLRRIIFAGFTPLFTPFA